MIFSKTNKYKGPSEEYEYQIANGEEFEEILILPISIVPFAN